MSKNERPVQRPCLLITSGEPAGIGPDILLQWFAEKGTPGNSDVLAIADPELLRERARVMGLDIDFHITESTSDSRSGMLNVLPCKLDTTAVPGKLDSRNAGYVLRTLELATDLCLDGLAHAITTGPVQKSIINAAGMDFSGHTEFFANRCCEKIGQTTIPVMMLATPGLRVALVTTHMPLRAVADQITPDRLRHSLEVLYEALENDFAISEPHIIVAGLNPHAGENGHLGLEEKNIIEPVLENFRQQGMRITGPLPADTLFTPRHLEKADAVLAMYHDQGLPVLKHLGFGRAVNITLGLPIIRTSVDHGTALDLAGSGKTDFGSLAYAIEVAEQLSLGRQKQGKSQAHE